MNLTDSEIASSPAFYPHTFDARGDRVMLVKLSAADYRLSSFLDSRMLAPGFGIAEREARLTKLQGLLQQQSLAALLIDTGSTLVILSESMRARMSAPPPAANGTMILTVRFPCVCAGSPLSTSGAMSAISRHMRRMGHPADKSGAA